MTHLDRYNIFTHCHMDFMLNILLSYNYYAQKLHDFTLSLNEEVQTDAVLLNLSKAFDKVVDIRIASYIIILCLN